ncbi:hypothetical protein ACFV8T_29395 [Streptomyces sp. NPDC059832]|uniref:hypothetical protein n=1 Tax=unclassified Streptomyces TaxID=2593676 RepID=UPI003646755F
MAGFGADEGAALPGSDLLLQAVGGLMSATGPAPGRLTGSAPGRPVKTGLALVDVLT